MVRLFQILLVSVLFGKYAELRIVIMDITDSPYEHSIVSVPPVLTTDANTV
jgi:hypothetical protein